MQVINKDDLKSRLALILYLAGFAAELWAIKLFSFDFLIDALIVHISAACLISWSIYHFMKKHFRANKAILVLFFLLCLFIPVVSGICLLLSLAAGLYFSKPTENEFLEVVEPIDLSKAIHTAATTYFSEGRVHGILKFSKREDRRIKAVLSTRQMSNESAIPILRIALLDSADEVRLLAYSILDNKEKNIGLIINKGSTKLTSCELDKDEISVIHRSLAEAYWELSYLGLAKGRARIHALYSAKKHVAAALKPNNKDVSLHFLQSRIMTNLGFYEEADIALGEAKNYGMPAANWASRSAELAFELKRFNKVAKHVKQIDKIAQNNIIVDGMVRQWV